MLEKDFDAHLNLSRIRELTHRDDIIPLKSIADFSGERVDYECEKGSCHGIGLYKDGAVAVQFASLEAGTVMKAHTHIDNREFLIVISGELFSAVNEKISSAKVGEVLQVGPGETHVPYCHIPTTIIGVTVPASPGYPDARH